MWQWDDYPSKGEWNERTNLWWNPSKRNHKWTQHVYIYTLPNANFPLKNLCVEPCWAVLFSHHLHVENAHPLLHYNAELLIRKSFWTLPCISWAAHRAINQYPCWHAYVHLATKKTEKWYRHISTDCGKSSITLIWQFVSNMPSPSELEEHLVLYHSLLLREQKLGSWSQAYSPIGSTNLKRSWVSTQGNHMTPASRHRILTQTPPTLKKHMEPKMGLEDGIPKSNPHFRGSHFTFGFQLEHVWTTLKASHLQLYIILCIHVYYQKTCTTYIVKFYIVSRIYIYYIIFIRENMYTYKAKENKMLI